MLVDHITVRETVAFDATAGIRRTKDGYLVAAPRVARTGIQVYGGAEVGRQDLDRVRVYRPEAEVFDKAALATIAHRPITNDHPSEPVTADNWRKYAVGQVDGNVARDGEFVRVPMVVMDGPTIADVEAGKRELSLGYSADLVWRTGVTDSGEEFDAVQTNIRVNHLAIVDAARGGPKLKIGDESRPEITGVDRVPLQNGIDNGKTGDRVMADKTYTIDGISVEMSEVAHQIVQRTIQKIQDEAKVASDKLTVAQTDAVKAKDAADAALAEVKKASETKDAEIVTLKKQIEDAKITPKRLDEMVKDRAEVIAKAKAVLGDELVVDGKDLGEIRKQVVDKKLGDAAKDWNDDQVRASFATLTADVKVEAAAPGVADATARVFSGKPIVGDVAKVEKLRADRDTELSNAWKGEAASK